MNKYLSPQVSCVVVLHVNVGLFAAQLKCTANGISVQNVNVLPNIYGHIFVYFNKFHAICKGKFQKCDHIYLAIHSHSALIFRLRCISIARKKILHLRDSFKKSLWSFIIS
jgi:hypothetical protein